MKPTQKIETEVLKVYNIWLHSYLNGDVETYDKYLDDAYHFIGSTNNEEFLTRKATTKFFEDTAEQLAGKCKLKNEKRTLEKFGALVFVTHLFDAWFLNGADWSYYGRFRFTSTLQEKKEGWRFIYQHFSTTDSKAEEGETIGFDQVSKENLQLKEAIKRRTFELEEKNRELEVEGALERIRAQAVAMQQSSDLLDIVVTMRNEFIKLGHEAHYFWHMMWLPKTYEKAMTSGDGTKIGFVMELPRHIHGDISQLAKWEKSNNPTVVHAMNTEKAIDYVDKMVALGDFQNIDPQAPSHDDIRHIGGLTFIMARTSHGEIGYSLPGVVQHPPKEDIDILVKFAGAFDLAHRRFLDLQKAEKQRRETQIELALEKVRSRTMAMQNSEELEEVILEVLKKLQGLGISMEERAAAIFTYKAGNKDYVQWVASPEYNSILSFNTPYFDHPVQNDIWHARQNKTAFYAKPYPVEVKNSLFKYMFDLPALKNMPKAEKTKALKFKHYGISIGFQKHAALVVVDHSGIPLTESENSILIRLSKVFNQTYTRFLDLQKAEKQAREVEIELALEKVRSRTMAMQHSDELQEASFLLDQQVQALGIRTRGCAFNIFGQKHATEWFSSEQGTMPVYHTPRENVFLEYYEAGKRGESLYIKEFEGDACIAHYDYLCTLPVMGKALRELKANGGSFPERQIDHVTFFKYGYLLFITLDFVPEAHDIFKRFAKVFEQTYTRFLDLQKAEAQAREAQIETALERVRSRSLAMHNSEELLAVIEVVSEQLRLLDLKFDTISFGKNYQESDFKFWLTSSGQPKPLLIQVPFFDSRVLKSVIEAQKKENDFIADVFTKEENRAWSAHIIQFSALKNFPDHVKDFILNSPGFARSSFLMQHIDLYVGNYRAMPFTAEENAIFKRFAQVFSQAYTRFLDLQKAEAQAREAQIEATLEKVRSRSLAMHKSHELKDVVAIIFEKLKELQIPATAVGIGIYIDGSKDLNAFVCGENKEGLVITNYHLPYFNNKISRDISNMREKQLDFFVGHYTKEEKDFFYSYVIDNVPEFGALPEDIKQIILDSPSYTVSTVVVHNAVFSVNDFEGKVLSDREIDIFKRFARVFDQAYTRFLDLEKAEAQAREAQIEMALEKVRSRTMAMQHSDELHEAAKVLFSEIQALGIPSWSCGYNLLSDDNTTAQSWMSTQGNMQEVFTLEFKKEASFLEMYTFFESDDSFLIQELGDKTLESHYAYMRTIPSLGPAFEEIKQGGIQLPSFQINHLYKFNKGYLLFITYEKIPEAHDIFKRFTTVFEQTYTRFNDLKLAEANTEKAEHNLLKLQAAKKSAEKALSELQLTQTQLIQSEKMASLGELTAGIAHEIQNPLNFVNNFSEVSKELLEEMQEEIENGDFEEVKAIMEDVIQNLEKINHHGKRADGIVKGMLQHSRSSTGTKEPTNINLLADEYLRLAYHGLRAKDKEFNADMETNFDDSIKTTTIIPQDIGRVVLNLVTNAFYAVNEKAIAGKASGDTTYKPLVSIATKKKKNSVEITVTDNGNGMPESVKEKVFQPFFTTKPTGQGTGLGLSMSYDIVTKGHGGEIRLESKEGEGTTFSIVIPN